MEAEIRRELGLDVELIKGDRGVFDVRRDGELIFSKKECAGRFPRHDEIIAMLRRSPA